MSKKQTYLFLLAMGLILVFIGEFMNFNYIRSISNNTFIWMKSPYIFAPAAVCAFIFMNNKRYWLLNIVAALITSLVIQYVILHTSGTLFIVLIRVFAFIVIVYLLNLIKIILNK